MQRSFAWGMIAILAIMVAPFAGVLGAPANVVQADTTASAAVPPFDDEIIVITSALQLRVDDPTTPTGYKPATWDSGAETGFTVVAAGDFNGDGDAELVAARGSVVRVFDPVVQPGKARVDFSVDLSTEFGSGSNVKLLSAGDFDADGRDEFAVMHFTPGSGNQARLVWYDGGEKAIPGEWTKRNAASYGAMFQDMSVGDFNTDGADDLVMVRNANTQYLTSVWNVRSWTTIAERTDTRPWHAVAGGNLSTSTPGDEISLTRDGSSARTEGLILFKVVSGRLEDLVANSAWRWSPDFVSLANGDLNGDGDDEVVMLRDPTWATTSLLTVNPTGATTNPFEQATGYGSAAFRIVRTGDTDGDGMDEIVILKGDRYRIYTEPNVDSRATETTGAFYAYGIPGTVANLPFMALANVDGPGISQGPMLGVTPTTLSFSVDYGAVSPVQPLTMTNVGSGSSFQWKATVIEGSLWLLLNGQTGAVLGNTPGHVNVSVKTDAVNPGPYPGKIRVTTTDPSVGNNTVDIPVTLTLRDPGFAASPSALTIWQKIGGNPSPPTVTSEVKIVRPVKATPWTATALSRDEAAVLMEKLAIGQATVTSAGPVIDGVMVPPPAWLKFEDDEGTTPSTMTVSVRPGTTAGTYHGVIVIAAGDPSLPEGVSLVYVTAIVADHFNFTFLPLVTK